MRISRQILSVVLIFFVIMMVVSSSSFAIKICRLIEVDDQSADKVLVAEELQDGVYEGVGSNIVASVTITKGAITDIVITKHTTGDYEYAGIVTQMIEPMIQTQSSDVDTITGATISSTSLIEAVEDALSKAAQDQE